MTTQTIDRVFAGCLAALGVSSYGTPSPTGMRDDAGTRLLSILGRARIVGLSIANLVRSLRGAEILESQFDAVGLYKALAIVGFVTGFILLTPWLGMLVASGLLIPALAFAIRPRWTRPFAATIVAVALLFPVLCYYLFAVYLQVPLVRGVFGV